MRAIFSSSCCLACTQAGWLLCCFFYDFLESSEVFGVVGSFFMRGGGCRGRSADEWEMRVKKLLSKFLVLSKCRVLKTLHLLRAKNLSES